MSELTPEQKAYVDKLVEKHGIKYVTEYVRRMALYLGTDEERASLRGLPPLDTYK